MVINKEKLRKEFDNILYDFGIQKGKIAKMSGMHYNSLYRWLDGSQEISWDTWLALIEALPKEARERYLSSVFDVLGITRENLSLEAKRKLFVELAADFAYAKSEGLKI